MLQRVIIIILYYRSDGASFRVQKLVHLISYRVPVQT